jgi:hypothetical protein
MAGSGLLLGSLVSGGIGLGKAVLGGIQAIKGNKQMKRLLANRPTYNIPEAYKKALGLAQGLAASEMPGQQRYEDLIGQTTSRAMTGAEKGAISSNVYQGAVESAQDKELQALQDLAQMSTQWQTQQKQNLIGAQQQYGQLEDQQFQYNIAQPWDIKANMASEQKIAGVQNLFGGVGDIGQSVMNFTGTRYYTEMMKELQKVK